MTDPSQTGPSPDAKSDETERQRHNRQLIELLNELRIALPGVQVLFAFLLVVPFSTGFGRASHLDRNVYFVTLACTAISAAFFMAPSAYHRIVWKQGEKRRLLHTSNKFTIIGLVFLALAMVGVILLTSDYMFGSTTVFLATAGIAVLLFGLWFAFPLYRRFRATEDERKSMG
jgi:hypothetical protein